MVYGASVVGMRPSELRVARAIAHAAIYEHTRGRSVGLDFGLEADGADPAFRAKVDVILHWKAALMDRWAPRARMLRAMLRAMADAACASCPFASVFGPCLGGRGGGLTLWLEVRLGSRP